ncbi:MAG: ABC transporter substrate-binding protein [Candidatus Contendobacter sp.]|nr:ABC transporter substrate-binding protein [Candidatus Contendobacter sp.]MDG4557956.1 ABC transporter substrate-binding protein [Candidatus Contendobacter sp.]
MSNAKRKWWPFVAALLVVVIGLFLLFINGENKPPSDQTFTYRLKWLANTGFIGDLYAVNYGYFREEGLNVQVKPGGPEHDAIRELLTEEAAFGVASADQVINALGKGAKVIVIAQIYRKNPVQWIYRSRLGKLSAPQDLRGRSVGITVGDNDATIMLAVLRKADVPYHVAGQAAPQNQESTPSPVVELLPVRYDFAPFLKNNLDLFPVYKNTQGVDLGIQMKSAGEVVSFFDPEEYGGVHFVANSIVTTERMLKTNPTVVRAFLSAVLKGWKEALDPKNEALAIRAMLNYVRESSTDSKEVLTQKLQDQIRITADLVLPPPGAGLTLGTIDVASWKETEAIMLQQGIIKSPIRVENYLATELLSGK